MTRTGGINSVGYIFRRFLSAAVGYFTQLHLPSFILAPIIRRYVKHYKINMDEFALQPQEAATFGQYFARPLKNGLCPAADSSHFVLSPADGVLTVGGKITNGRLQQIKGSDYSLNDFVGDPATGAQFENGDYFVVYLSPRDYHRVHFPADGAVGSWHYIPGDKITVRPGYLKDHPGVFVRNERLVVFLETPRGPLAVVMVGATCVGRMDISFDPMLEDVQLSCENRHVYDKPLSVAAGGELGMFQMGSTVVVLAAPGMLQVDNALIGQNVKVNQAAGDWQ